MTFLYVGHEVLAKQILTESQFILFQHAVPLNVSSILLQWSNSTAASLSWARPDSSVCSYAYSISAFTIYNSSIQVNPSISGTTGKPLIFTGHFTFVIITHSEA